MFRWCHHLSLGQERVTEKSNEIIAIPYLLRKIDIRKALITIDAMGTQNELARAIIEGKEKYCLAAKGNQRSSYEDILEYIKEKGFLKSRRRKACTIAR